MIGSVVSHYRVLDRLGAGGMGVVYRAEDLRLGRHVALKFLPESATADPLATERFQREARTTSALNHPNICTLHDVGEHEGRRFIVMELIDGATLDKVLGAGALPVDRVIEISATVADALDAAHSEGILHRDIKPGNIFITKRGQVKVVDFGLAKIMPQRGLTPVEVTIAEQHPLTSAGMAVGTVAYMSPEHARGEPIDPRSDLFSLGVVMYEMATGVQTFKGQTTAVIFDQILNRVPVPPSHLNPDVIPALEHIIGRLLEKDRARRYQSARDVQADLQRLKRDLELRRVVTADATQTSPPPLTWTPPTGHPSHAQTMAVNVPTFGVEADPAPVPAAWAAGWELVRPPSHPEVDSRAALAKARSTATALESGPAPTATPSPVSPSAPTVMVPASGPSRVAGAPPPLPATPDAAASDFETVLAYVPHAPDAATAQAAQRDSAQGTEDTQELAPISVPAVWTTPPTSRPRQGLNTRSLAVASATALTLSLAIGGVWWMLKGREVAVSGEATFAPVAPPATVAPPPVTTPATPVETPSAATAAAATPTPNPSAPGNAATPPRPAPPANATANGAVPPAPKPGAAVAATPAPRPGSCALAAQAAALLTEAQGLLQGGAEDEALAKIGTLRASFGGTPAAREGALIAARTHQGAKRYEAAAAAWIDAERDGVGAEEISEGLIQAADGAARLRSAEGDVLARKTLGDLLDRYPASVRALRALQMKMSIEDRLKLKETDSELRGTAPASLLTLRQTARVGGTAPVAEFALWRLAQEYRERRLFDLAAQTFVDLGTRFPETRYDAWFSAAELYEKQLKDAARARDAYAKVPAASPKFEAAQKKLG